MIIIYLLSQSYYLQLAIHNMSYTFELHTTTSAQICVTVDGNMTMKQVTDIFFCEIEKKTVFQREEILDIFVQIAHCNETLSIPCSNTLVKDFIPMNRKFFPYSADNKNTYHLHAIDRMYRERIDCKIDPQTTVCKNRDIKTSHMGEFIQRTRKIIPFW